MSNAGYKTQVFLSADGVSYTEVDGIKSVQNSNERVELDTTDFKTAGILRDKLMGLRDGTFSLSGDFVAGDAGQEIFLDACDSTADNPPLYIRVLWDGVAGVEAKITAASYSISAEVEGLVTLELSGSLNGAFTRV